MTRRCGSRLPQIWRVDQRRDCRVDRTFVLGLRCGLQSGLRRDLTERRASRIEAWRRSSEGSAFSNDNAEQILRSLRSHQDYKQSEKRARIKDVTQLAGPASVASALQRATRAPYSAAPYSEQRERPTAQRKRPTEYPQPSP